MCDLDVFVRRKNLEKYDENKVNKIKKKLVFLILKLKSIWTPRQFHSLICNLKNLAAS